MGYRNIKENWIAGDGGLTSFSNSQPKVAQRLEAGNWLGRQSRPVPSRSASAERERTEQSCAAAQFQNGSESTKYHPFAIKGHWITLRTEPRIAHDLRHGGVSR
jgi:hypothetical protein